MSHKCYVLSHRWNGGMADESGQKVSALSHLWRLGRWSAC